MSLKNNFKKNVDINMTYDSIQIEDPYNLPSSWAWSSLDNVIETIESGNRPKGGVRGISGGVISVGGEHLNDFGTFKFDKPKFIPEEFFFSMKKGIIKENDVLIVKDGATTGKVSFVPSDFPYKKAAVNEHVFILRGNDKLISQSYLFWYLFSLLGQSILKPKITGSAQGGINQGFLERFPIPLAPLPEQLRITTKLKEIFTKIDKIRQLHTKINAQIEIHRQSFLKSIFEGKFTKTWREKHDVDSKDLLKLIKSKNSSKKKNFTNIINNFQKIPKEWSWVVIGDIVNYTQYGTSEKAIDDETGVPILRMGNIIDGKLDFSNLKFFNADWKLMKNFLLNEGDILFNRTNSAELVGKTAVYEKKHPKAIFASYLIRIGVDKELYDPYILSSYINSQYGRMYINSVVTQQVGQANVNGTKLNVMPIPLIHPDEQKIISLTLQNYSSSYFQNLKLLSETISKLHIFEQSILKSAFEGKLVSQNSNDQPVSTLLKNINIDNLD